MSPAPVDGRAAPDKLPEGDLALLEDFRRDLDQKKSERVRLRRIAGSGRLSPFGKRVLEDRIRVVEESIRRLEGLVGRLAGGPAGESGDWVAKRVREVEEALKDPAVRLFVADWERLAERIEPKLERLLQTNIEIAGMLRGPAAEGTRRSAPPAGPPGGGGTVEAEFCGRTPVDVVLRVDAFMRATGLKLVERRLLGFVDVGGDRQECHRAVFRRG